MKILALRLTAFGPFTNGLLHFEPTDRGLHLVYGHNEAGKSSALRAIRQLLYGMDRISRDAFLHPAAALRLGGTLERQDGRLLEFVRRKADKRSLRQGDDQTPLDDETLAAWLGGVDELTFRAMFGIDHAALREGGAEIMRGKGRLAETLFSAAAGMKHLRKVVEQLSNHYLDIYKPSGKNQRIAELQRELREARKRLAELQLSANEWEELDRQLKESLAERGSCAQQLEALLAQRRQIDHHLTALPLARRRRQALLELEELQHAPTLPENFRSRYDVVMHDVSLQSQRTEDARARCEQLASALETGDDLEPLLAQAADIEELRERLGSHRKAAKDRQTLLLQEEQARTEAARIRERWNSQADQATARLAPDLRIDLQELAARKRTLQEQKETLASSILKLEQKLQQFAAPMPVGITIADSEGLRALLTEYRMTADLDAEIERLAAAVRTSSQRCDRLLQQLNGWSGTAEALDLLAVPSMDDLEQVSAAQLAFAEQAQQLQSEQQQLERERDSLSSELDLLEAAGPLPTMDDLTHARHARDETWQAVRTAWKNGVRYDADLAAALTSSLATSDAQADRLRIEAERAMRKTTLQARHAELEKRQQKLSIRQESLNLSQQTGLARWSALWPSLEQPPCAIAHARDWLHQRDEVLRAREAALDCQRELERKEQQRHEAIAQMAALTGRSFVTATSQPSLRIALSQAHGWLTQLDRESHRLEQQRGEEQRVRTELNEARAVLEHLDGLLRAWQSEWTSALSRGGLTTSASAEGVFALISEFDRYHQLLDEAEAYRARIRGIEHDAAIFRQDVESLSTRWLATEDHGELADKVAALDDRLRRAQVRHHERQQLQQRLQQERTEFDRLRDQRDGRLLELQVLCQMAGVGAPDDLESVITRSERRRERLQIVDEAEEALRPLTHNEDLPAFAERVCLADSDELRRQLSQIEDRVQDTTQRSSTLDQTIGTLREQLQRMRGEGAAAEQANRCEFLVTELEEAAREYAVWRLAAAVLQRGMEEYRDRHQGPLLSRASELFRRMSCDSFSELRTDLDDRGVPLLIGVRPEGRATVGVDGMSDGTCDQVYLALRLAALELWLDTAAEPMPLIVDDILLNFDDRRAAATLQVLAEVSRRTQVMFFTHHQRLMELAKEHLPEDGWRAHVLGA